MIDDNPRAPRPDDRALNTPWTAEQVSMLNTYQKQGRMHPFTCPSRDVGHSDHGERDTGILVATEDGWVCRDCGYRQDWAWDWMANGFAL